jgi:hypothetical protein
MILVRTNPKLAIAIVAATLLTSIFTVFMVTRTTNHAVDQGVAIQQQTTKQIDDAIKQSNAASTAAQTDAAAAVKAATDTNAAAVKKSTDDAAKIADDVAKQVAAATGEQ